MKNLSGLRNFEKRIINNITDLKITGDQISCSQANYVISVYKRALDRMDSLDLKTHLFPFAEIERSSLLLDSSEI